MKFEKNGKTYKLSSAVSFRDMTGIFFRPTSIFEVGGDIGISFGCRNYSITRESIEPPLLVNHQFGIGRTGKFRFCNEYEVFSYERNDETEIASRYRHDISEDFRSRITRGVKL